MKLRILTEDDVRGLVVMADAIDLQAKAFIILAEGGSIEGLRSFALSDDPPGGVIFNPSFLKGGKGYGIKVVSDFYGNSELGVPRMSAIVALFDGETGLPRTIMEAGYMSDLRTGAGTALAARHLARRDSRVLTLVGAGRVARNQLAALSEVCRLEKVRVVTRSEGRGREFVERMSAAGGKVPTDIELALERDAAVGDADIVVCATTARQPVIDGAALSAGTFVAAVGAHDVGAREVDTETIRRAAKRVVDSPVDSLKNAGDLMVPLGEGVIGEDDIASIADVVAGRRAGRQSDDEITYYKGMGVPIQDLVTAQYIESRAEERGVGTIIDIGGDHD
ncbi:MAG: ornithine cyclodeaminase family protein [Rhodospirillales bacterium]|jgi:ornithine cyclodeaminase/alanine dehydrogenase-like protein (mu-crystallin family)|nr:ornithine cyclodeaminase family protein [Rhodospirillales bacterium]HJO72809.1 ornithine cyclodeaminase family protein [Rhodospirillales bacterium]